MLNHASLGFWPLLLAGAATSIIFVTTKVLSWQTRLSWQNMSFVATKVCLSCCRDKNFVCCGKIMFVATNTCSSWGFLLLWQAYFCHNKRPVLSWQTRVCLNKRVCHDKTFVVTKMILVAIPVNDTAQLTFHTDIYSRPNKGTSGIDWKWCLCVHKIDSFVVFL